MDRWIALHEGATGPKLRLFATLAGCSETDALGVLCHIWIWGVRGNVTSTGLMKNANQEHIKNIFAGALTKGVDPQQVVDALIKSGWIDETDGEYFIHDWPEHQKPWVKYQAEKEANKRRKQNQRSRTRQLVADLAASAAEEPSPMAPVSYPEGALPDEPPKPAKPRGCQYPKAFEEFWAAYPRKDEKANAHKQYQARIRDGFSADELLEAARAYAARCKQQQTEKQFIKLGKTFLSANTPFIDFLRKDDSSGRHGAGGQRDLWAYDPGDTSGSL